MPQAVDSIGLALEQLSERVRELERRVAALEHQPEESVPAAPQLTGLPQLERTRPPATWRGFPPAEMPGGSIPVLGRAVLGIAGAYLLRALAESGGIPKLPVLFVAIVYAALWMLWAVRTYAASRFAGVTYGVTSALILSPLLWESTIRFQVLAPALASAVLAAYLVLTLALAWRGDLQLIPWIATLATVGTALALIIATHEVVPLTAALLATALATEVATCLGHRLSVRAVPALAADFSVWLLGYVLASESVPEGYHPAAAPTIAALSLGLLAIYGGTIAVRCFVKRQPITAFEAGQGVVAFVLAAHGALRASQMAARENSGAIALGAFFLLLAAACYWGALSRFADDAHARNRRVSATWAAALFLAASFLLFPVNLRASILCCAAAAAAFVYTRTTKLSLGLHTSLYLLAAAAVSSLPGYVAGSLAGAVPLAPEWSLWIVVISSVACYVIGSGARRDQGKRRLLWVVPAALVGFIGASFAVAALVWFFAGRMELSASRLSVIRTIVNCVLAVVLGYVGARWRRIELGWVAYTAVAFGTLKLLFEDLRFGNAASLVVSLLFYGLVLILLPRFTRRERMDLLITLALSALRTFR